MKKGNAVSLALRALRIEIIGFAVIAVLSFVLLLFTFSSLNQHVSNRQYALSVVKDAKTWTLQDLRPNPNSLFSGYDVTYVFQSERWVMRLVVSISNPNRLWYDKVRIGDRVFFQPTVEEGDNSFYPALSAYMRPAIRNSH